MTRLRTLPYSALAGGAGVAASLIGLMGLAGWVFELEILKSALPGLVAMKANTALGLILSGASLWLSRRPEGNAARHRLAQGLGLVVALAGLLTLAEYLGRWDLGIDNWLFRETPGAAGTAVPGRMAFFTALNFLLLGLALWWLNISARGGWHLPSWLAMMALANAAVNLLGYMYEVPTLYQHHPLFTHIALPTALALLLLSLGVLLARPDQGVMAVVAGTGLRGFTVRRLFPLVLLPLAVGFFEGHGSRLGFYSPATGEVLEAMCYMATSAILVWYLSWSLERVDLQMRQAFQREEAMGRIRDRIINLRHLEELAEALEKSWVKELRGLGIPIHSTSLQFPAEQEGYFTTLDIAAAAKPRMAIIPLADYPWVREAWKSGRPVVVDRRRLDQAKFDKPIQVLIEVPLPGGGSVGLNSLEEHAFGEEAVRTLVQFAGLLAEGNQRLQDFEVLRRAEEETKIALAMQQVRNQALKMEGSEDWDNVVLICYNELKHLIACEDCSLNLVDLQRRRMDLYVVDESYQVERRSAALPPVVEQAMETGDYAYRARRSDPRFGAELGVHLNSVIDMPFAGGTLAVNSRAEDAFSSREIQILAQFAQVMSEAHRRLEDLQMLEKNRHALAQAFRREEAMGRFRDRIIAMKNLAEMGGEIEKTWIGELRGLGIPINRVSLQLPAAEKGSFLCQQGAFLSAQQINTGRLADAPWVEEAWEGKRPVVVDRQRLDQAGGFRAEVQSLLEVPLPGVGSLGLNSLEEHAFGEEEVRTVQALTNLLAEGIQRLRDFEALRLAEERLKVDVALQRVRNEVLRMEHEEDWKRVLAAFHQELHGLIAFADCGINLLDRQRDIYLDYEINAAGELKKTYYEILPRALAQALDTGQVEYRRNRAEIDQFGDPVPPGAICVLDVPFSGGTVAINSGEEDAFSPRDIQILRQFAQVMSEAHRRLQDLQTLAQREAQLRQAQHLESLGQLATGVAHEINNPLTSVLGYSEWLLHKAELDPKVRGHLETIHQEGERARQVAERLLRFSQRQKVGQERQPLNPLVQEAMDLVQRQYELNNIRLVAELGTELPLVQVQPGQVQQLVLNLLQNSQEAILKSGKGREIRVQTSAQDGKVRLMVEDDGPGIPDEVRQRIFDPFFTTKEVGSGRGTGMGLPLCYAIAEEHDSRLWAEARPVGACLVLELPAAAGVEIATNKEALSNAR